MPTVLIHRQRRLFTIRRGERRRGESPRILHPNPAPRKLRALLDQQACVAIAPPSRPADRASDCDAPESSALRKGPSPPATQEYSRRGPLGLTRPENRSYLAVTAPQSRRRATAQSARVLTWHRKVTLVQIRQRFERNELRPINEGNSICYLIGAGFSAASKYNFPTSTGFLSRQFPPASPRPAASEHVLSHEYQNGASEFSRLLDRIESQYGPLERMNLEDILTDLHVRALGIGRAWGGYTPPRGRVSNS